MKRWISALLVVAMLVGVLPVTAADAAVPSLTNFKTVQRYDGSFTDVVVGSWYEADVERVFELGLLKGRSATSFAPNGEIQISEALTFACRLHSIYHTGAADFVQGSPWYQVYVDYAVENGIIAANEYLDYTATATRAQFAQIFAKVLPDAAMPYINDVVDGYIPDLTADMACYEAAYHLYRAGILQGRDATGTFKPETHITRAEIAAILTRMADIGARKLIDSGSMFDGFEEYIEVLGLSTEKSEQKTISGREMTALLDKLVAYAAPEKLAEWQTKYPVLRASEDPLNRYDTLAALYLALWHVGGDYGYITPVLDHNRPEMKATGGDVAPTWELFGEVPLFDIQDWGEDHYGMAGLFFNISRVCLVDGEYPLSYDEKIGSFRRLDSATYADGLLAVLRAVCIAETEYTVDSMKLSYVITDQLLAKANANPIVTSENHPRWTGFVLGYGALGRFDTSADEIRLSAEWGFNSARVILHYETLFSTDGQTADLMQLIELDKLVAAAIENDVHLNILLSEIPGRNASPADAASGWVSTADLDLFINAEKQEQALNIYRILAARYQDIPNFNLSITPFFEALNRNRSTGLPAPEYTAEDVAVFLGKAIDAIREEDPDRLIIYEPIETNGYDVFVEQAARSKAIADSKGNVIISYNFCESAYVYACMTMTEGKHIDNMNRSLDLQPYPNYIYSICSHIDSDHSLTLDGCLPAGTIIDFYLEQSYAKGKLNICADGVNLYSEMLTGQRYEVGERLSSYYPYAESDKHIRITLENETDEIVISAENGVDFCGIYLTLPDEYAKERWYMAQAYDVALGLEEKEGVAKRTSSGLMLAPNDYWNGWQVTIHDDLTYTSEHVWSEASVDTIRQNVEDMNRFDGNGVIRFERGTFGGALWSELREYYEDLLKTYEEYGFSWWSNDWWEITNKTGTIAEVEYVEYAGYEHFNMELLQLLQKYQSKD